MNHSHLKKTIATIGIGLMAFGLTACSEKEPVEVPDVSGMTGDEAKDQLRDLDFEIEMNALDGSAVFSPGNWEVESTDPAAGDMIDPKSEITVNLVRPAEDGTEEESSPAAPASPEFELEYHDEYESAVVRFQVRDGFSRGLISTGAHTDTVRALEAGIAEYPDAQKITVIGTFPESDAIMMDPYYERDTIDQIDFDNAMIEDIWTIRDGGAVHNDLLENQ